MLHINARFGANSTRKIYMLQLYLMAKSLNVGTVSVVNLWVKEMYLFASAELENYPYYAFFPD